MHDAAVSQNAALERQLRESGATLEDTRRDWTSEVSALAEQLARREAEAGAALAEATRAAAAEIAAAAARYAALEERLGQEATVRTTLEERLAATETASQDAARQHATELASLTARLADLQAQSEAAAERSLQHQTELAARLAEATAARAAVENRLAEAEALHRHEQERFAAELAGAAERHRAIQASSLKPSLPARPSNLAWPARRPLTRRRSSSM